MTITYAVATDADQINAAVAKLTKLGLWVMQAIGDRKTSFFDNGIVENSGIYGECLGGEIGAKPGTLTGLVKQGLLTTYKTEDGVWYDLTALGADVANHLAGTLEPVKIEVEVVEPIHTPAQVTKSEAYVAVKAARKALSQADEAVYRGTQAQLEAALLEAVQQAQYLLDAIRSGGVNCGVPTSKVA